VKHAAIDLGGKESQICIRSADGTILEELRHPTRKLPELLAKWERSRVVMETSSEAFHIADAAKAAGHDVCVVPSIVVQQLGVGQRGIKNDERDAQALSEASCLLSNNMRSVHIPSHRARELKSIYGARQQLMNSARNFTNNVRGWMRTKLWRVRGGREMLPERLRAHAAALGQELAPHIEQELQTLEFLTKQLKAADKELKRIAMENPLCVRLMTVPGVGPSTAVLFVATIDDPTRFSSAHRVASYLGLTPGERSSSERERRTGITKAGPSDLRTCLVQGAWATLRSKTSHPMHEWAKQLADRRGQPVAVIALARKLAGTLFAIWRDGTEYKPKLSARPLLT
jgi:transposase